MLTLFRPAVATKALGVVDVVCGRDGWRGWRRRGAGWDEADEVWGWERGLFKTQRTSSSLVTLTLARLQSRPLGKYVPRYSLARS